jgi:hypothetical protein
LVGMNPGHNTVSGKATNGLLTKPPHEGRSLRCEAIDIRTVHLRITMGPTSGRKSSIAITLHDKI